MSNYGSFAVNSGCCTIESNEFILWDFEAWCSSCQVSLFIHLAHCSNGVTGFWFGLGQGAVGRQQANGLKF